MALSNYSELQSAVADWLERGDLTARIPDFIRLAEVQLNRLLRTNPQKLRATATISDPFSAIPSDHLETLAITLSDGASQWDLLASSLEQMAASAAENPGTGKPRFWTQVGEQFQYFPAPDQAYTATLTYVRGIPGLSDTNTTNWLLTRFPDAYLFGALKEAGPFLRDNDLASTFEAKFQAAAQDIVSSERKVVGTLRADPAVTIVGRGTFDINTGR